MRAEAAWLGAFWALYAACFAATRSARRACNLVGLAHHVLVVALAARAIAESPTILACESDCFAAASPAAWTLHSVNVGYFAYDFVLVALYYPKFVAHHAIVLFALALISHAGRGALGIAVSFLLAEAGGVAYAAYTLGRTRAAYVTFVAFYALTRVALAAWTWRVVARALASPEPFSLATAALQLCITAVNVRFCAHHVRKLCGV
jgi:hypothetical protein